VTQETGYTNRVLSANAPTSLPGYYHEHDLQHPVYSQAVDLTDEDALSRYKEFFPSSIPTYQPRPDHPTADGTPEAFVRSSHELYHDEWTPRGSAELTTETEEMGSSPVYESDAEFSSDGHGLPSPQSPSHRIRTERPQTSQSQDESFESPTRQDTANTAVSQPTSGDTVVEMQEHQQTTTVRQGRPASLQCAVIQGSRPESRMHSSMILQPASPVRLRRHSDTPLDSKKGRFMFPSRRLRASADGHQGAHEWRQSRGEIEKRTHRIPESSAPVIHPYVSCFLSFTGLLLTIYQSS
jgi:hypothetical protein